MTNEQKTLHWEIKNANLVLVDAQNSGISFSVTKALAKTIVKRAELSGNFKYRVSGATLILEV